MNTSSWQNADDIRRDLFEYSNMDYMEDTFAPAPPKSIAEYKARTSKVKNPGLFDDITNTDVGVFVSGRGKYLVDRIITPGRPVESVPEDDFNIKKRIREVSGLGYSNEIIERALHRGSDADVDNPNQDLITPHLKLNSSGSGISSTSGASSPRLSPLAQKSDNLFNFQNLHTANAPKAELKSQIMKTKKKKKFTKLCSGNPSVSVFNVNAPVWVPQQCAKSNSISKYQSSGVSSESVLNVNAPVWVSEQYDVSKIKSDDFPLLK